MIRWRSEKNVPLQPLAIGLAGRLGEADLHHLAGIVPLVDRRGDIEPLIALQPNQRTPQAPARAPWRSRSCRHRPRPPEKSGRLRRSARNSTVASGRSENVARILQKLPGIVDAGGNNRTRASFHLHETTPRTGRAPDPGFRIIRRAQRPVAAATARRAITPTRCARYSASA